MSTVWNIETGRSLAVPLLGCPFCNRTETLKIVALRNDEKDPLFVRTVMCIPCGYRPNATCGISDGMAIDDWNKGVERRMKRIAGGIPA